MRKWLMLGSYHWAVLLVMFAACALVLTWTSFGLINLAMANIDFLRRYGLMAVREGGLLQLAEISLNAFVAMMAYLGFKAIEVELVYRWRGAK